MDGHVNLETDGLTFYVIHGDTFNISSTWVDPWSDPDLLSETPIQKTLTELYAYPVPFNVEVSLSFTLGNTQEIQLDIFDLVGRNVANLHQGALSEGSHVSQGQLTQSSILVPPN